MSDEAKRMTFEIPQTVLTVIQTLEKAGHEGWVVGGCVRDLYLQRTPNDWDITTNANPEQIQELFHESEFRVVYENNFGTVGLVDETQDHDSNLRTIEVTPFRTETGYSDFRRPDEIAFAKTLEEDLKRRDFTINAMAYRPTTDEVVDLFGGKFDLLKGVIKTVGDAEERFTEDALRLIRAVRFSAQLGYEIEEATMQAMQRVVHLLFHVSWERKRDEFTKLVMSQKPFDGLFLMRETGMLKYVVPELAEGVGCEQNRSHIYDVFEHNVRACQTTADQGWPLHVRLAALFHDIAKPRTKGFDKKAKVTTFYNHEVVGAQMTFEIMKRLRYSKELTKIVSKLVRFHMFFSDTDKISHSAVRRMIRNVGKGHIWDLMNVRRSDRIGMGRPKAAPYRLRKYEAMIDEVLRDPIDVSMLKMNGDIMVGELGVKPGKEIGWILHILLEEALDDPTTNTLDYQTDRVKQLLELDTSILQKMGERGKHTQRTADEQDVKRIRKSHKVK